MQKLNLEANSDELLKIKKYLEQNVTPALAEKINNGVKITKDGKTLINKKTLDTFWDYAIDEARKLVKKNARGAIVDDPVVFGWAMHYFQEDDIIGKLYNEDGTAYAKVTHPSTSTPVKSTTPAVPKKPEKKQTSIFDILSADFTKKNGADEVNPYEEAKKIKEKYSGDEADEIVEDDEDEETIATSSQPSHTQGSKLYQDYMRFQNKYKDCILFYRLGDFYEALGDSAIKASKAIELTLTGRDCGLAERVAMCGIPHHAAENYFTKLAKKNFKVAVIESDSPITERVITADTVIENGQEVNVETGEIVAPVNYDELPIEELSVEEMKQFDYDGYGSGEDNEELITVSELTEGIDTDSDEDANLAIEREIAKAFDSETVAILADLLDEKVNIA